VNELIIDVPNLQNMQQRYGFATLTLFFWGLMIYMWLPFISLIAWLFGIEMFYVHMIELGGYVGFLELLGWYGLTISIIAIVFGGWMLVNRFRFQGKEKRKPTVHVTSQQVADFLDADADYISKFSKERSVIVNLTGHGKITSIEIK
jgi:biofilm PGA synthesis protein PgaD